jgi:hypothetical protein
MTDDTIDPGPRDDEACPSALPHDVPRACPTCGLAVPQGEIRCPRCRTLLVTACSGACLSCAVRTCQRRDDEA